MAMTVRIPPDREAELRLAAEEDHRTLDQTVALAVETYLELRETAEIKADPDAMRSLAEARAAARAGDVVYGVDALRSVRLVGWPGRWAPSPGRAPARPVRARRRR